MVVVELTTHSLALTLRINMSDSPSEVGTKTGAQETYPTQRHAGKVGYGPNYHTGPVRTSCELGIR